MFSHKQTSSLDVPFGKGAGDEEFMSALRHHLPRIIEEQNPGAASHGDCDYEIYTSKFHDLL
jgi:hypothetical protein